MTEPAFLPFALPDAGEEEIAAVADVIRSGWLTTGARAHEFETAFAEFVGARHAVAVSSCTAALHLALEAAGVGPGDRVATTPYTFTATAAVIEHLGARPVFVDVLPDTLNLDPDALARALASAGARAIVPVHVGGEPCDMDAIGALATRHGAIVIEDAAHALPSRYRGRTIGSLSGMTCFSFYASKTITTGEGGMLTTDHTAWAERCRSMSLHGIDRDAWKRYAADGSWRYEVLAPGFKYNLADIAAAMGLVQLGKAERMRARRAEIAARYDAAFAPAPELQIPAHAPENQHAWHLFMLRLRQERLRIDRARFIEELRRRGIGASVHFIPLHLHPYYRDRYRLGPDSFPVATREYEREISLPIYSRMSDADVARVIAAVQEIVAGHRT